MHDAYIPTFFTRHNRPLRGVMIDNQPWFSAYDFARLLGLHHPQALHRRLKRLNGDGFRCALRHPTVPATNRRTSLGAHS